ncbi:MAG: insulinase family protein [Deltaproteobacteria bacterium]|nr:insulinase family protein [Deltaproteobacteria bacterium]MBM4322779.1 insulinase family protein [Deltaproteobacteria bacterium]MBM4346750.1 insulinase family protein [Deltaproteobacteria bacterium]
MGFTKTNSDALYENGFSPEKSGYEKTILSNGIRVITETIPFLKSVSIGLWVMTGSRDEQPDENGISHFIEHLLFKGTERRTAFDIAKEIDSVGGTLNAFTGREYTCFYAKVIDKNLPLAIDLLSDIFLHSRMDEKDVEKERMVILQEIKMVEDTPDDYVHDLFNRTCWGNHPLGFPICGTANQVQSFRRDQIEHFFKANYKADRIIICAAGNLEHQKVVDLIGKTFGQLTTSDRARERVKPPSISTTHISKRDLEQVHFCLGTHGLHYNHSLRFASYVLNTILGGGMSSRLFQEIRENRGLAYSVYSYLPTYIDTGLVVVYAGTDEKSFEEAFQLILREFNRLKEEPFKDGELEIAKEQLKGNLLLSLESSDNLMTRLAKNEIYFNTYQTVESILKGIDEVDEETLKTLASLIFDEKYFCLTVLGPMDGSHLTNNPRPWSQWNK